MSHSTLGPQGISSRTQTHRAQLLTLWVSRQNQEFVIGNDTRIADIELIATSCELVGEPGRGGVGTVGVDYRSTINMQAVNEVGIESNVNGVFAQNRVLQRPGLNHGQLDVRIQGMTQGHQFLTDPDLQDNQVTLLVPTDLGLATSRVVDSPTIPLLMERVELQQKIFVHTDFSGNAPPNFRLGRFVQDWADSPPNFPGGFRRYPDSSIRYFNGPDQAPDPDTILTDEGITVDSPCQVPSNLITMLKLVFKVTPRSTL